MSRRVTGSIYKTKDGYGIRWVENGKRPQKGGFRTKTEARTWFTEHTAPRLRRGGPSPELTLLEFVAVYLDRWSPTVSDTTVRTVREWLGCPRDGVITQGSALDRFGRFRLAELEGSAGDIAAWRGTLPSEDRRHKAMRALRQVLAAAVRWGYLRANPAELAGPNPQPRSREAQPPSTEEIDRIAEEMRPRDAALIVFASETGLRTNEWMALERRDIDRSNPAVAVVRRWAKGHATPYPKTERSRRRVPLTDRAVRALELLPARLDTPLLFPSPTGNHLCLDNWRLRHWYPALEAAGLDRFKPYALRHAFATNALSRGVSIFELSRLMGTSVELLDRTYGHLLRESEDHLRGLLSAPSGVFVARGENAKW